MGVKREDWRGIDFIQGQWKLVAGKEGRYWLLLKVVLPAQTSASPCMLGSSVPATSTEAEQQQPMFHSQDLAVSLLAGARTWFWILILKR